MTTPDGRSETASAERQGWQRHVDPRDRSRRGADRYDPAKPWLEQGAGPPGHNL